MRVRLTVAALVAVLAGYLLLVGWRGVLLLGEGEPLAVALGVGVLLLPPVAGYLVWREVRFGIAAQRLARELRSAGRWPDEDLPRAPSGRPRRDAADALFERRRVEVEQAPEDWISWFRLGLAYDDARDRRRARAALRQAIRLHG